MTLARAGCLDAFHLACMRQSIRFAGTPSAVRPHMHGLTMQTWMQGNLVFACFLQLQSAPWRDKYVKAMVAVSAPFGGAVSALKGPISGDNFDLHFPHTLLHQLQGTAPSAPWLFPSPALWNADEILVSTNTRVYSAHNISTLLRVRPRLWHLISPPCSDCAVNVREAGMAPAGADIMIARHVGGRRQVLVQLQQSVNHWTVVVP